MPPIAVHFALGLAGAAAVGWWVRKYTPGNATLPWLAFGVAWGPVFVDADLLASSLASALAGFDTSVGKFLHRSVTHSIPVMAAVLIAGAFLWTRRQDRLGPFCIGFSLSVVAFHIGPDLFYLVPVKLWAPVSFEEVGPYAIGSWHFWKSDFSDAGNNLINGIDFLGESLLYIGVFFLARGTGTANRFTEKVLPPLAVVNALIFLPLTLFVAPTVSYDEFLIWSYAPGVVFIAMSTLVVPWKARATLLALGGQTAAHAREAPPRAVSVG